MANIDQLQLYPLSIDLATQEELSAVENKIPSKVGDLENDAGYITSSLNALNIESLKNVANIPLDGSATLSGIIDCLNTVLDALRVYVPGA